jgi:hypothetical protein
MIPGETVHSPLPQDLPWFDPGHFVFFSVTYLVLIIIGAGLGYCVMKAWKDSCCKDDAHGHH